MYLASHLGCASPLRMLEGMRPADLALWRAYHEHHPFGEDREDLRHGIRAMLFANANSKKRYKVEDFIPSTRSEVPKGPQDQVGGMMAFAAALTEQFGGTVREGIMEYRMLTREEVFEREGLEG